MALPSFVEELRDVGFEFVLQDGTVATLCDLNATGMSIETRASLRTGQELDFQLQLPGSPLAFTATGVILRQRARGPVSRFQVQFTRLQMTSDR